MKAPPPKYLTTRYTYFAYCKGKIGGRDVCRRKQNFTVVFNVFCSEFIFLLNTSRWTPRKIASNSSNFVDIGGGYGVATISRLLIIIGLFCRISSLL